MNPTVSQPRTADRSASRGAEPARRGARRPTLPLPQAPGRPIADCLVAALVASLLCGGVLLARGPSVSALCGMLAAVAVFGFACVLVLRRTPRRSGPADRVTLVRAVLITGCTPIAVVAAADGVRTWWLFPLLVPALALDAVDGYVARSTATASREGALFDQEMDAALLLVLSLAAVPTIGWWAAAIGLMRYAFLVVGRVRARQRGRLPYSRFRRAVAGVQGVLLAVGLAPVVPVALGQLAVGLALGLLSVSFGRDVIWLERHPRPTVPSVSRTAA